MRITYKALFMVFAMLIPAAVMAEGTDELPGQGLGYCGWDSGYKEMVPWIWVTLESGQRVCWETTDSSRVADGQCWGGDPKLEVYSSHDGTVSQYLDSLDSGYCLRVATDGDYMVRPTRAIGVGYDWNVSVYDSSWSQILGRVYSYYWMFNNGGFDESKALTGSFYVLIKSGQDYGLMEMKLEGYSGWWYDVFANSYGLDAPYSGWSVPWDNHLESIVDYHPSVTPQWRIYLEIPQDYSFDLDSPTISGFAFSPPEQSCQDTGEGVGGSFTITTDSTGTYHIVCDTNGDGRFDPADHGDVLLVGQTSPGTSLVQWDGLDRDGNPVPAGTYQCRVDVASGEVHFIASDIETAYPGLRMFAVDDNGDRSGLYMYWDDHLVQQWAVTMPSGSLSPESSPEGGLYSGSYSDPAQAYDVTPQSGDNARAWGAFTGGTNQNTIRSKGDYAYLDTYASMAVGTYASDVTLTILPSDSDGDTVSDYAEVCIVGSDPNNPDSDGDSISDGYEVTDENNPADTDHDGTPDALDTDSDNDGISDSAEAGDSDITTNPVDTDDDGTPDFRDPDSDGDGVADGSEGDVDTDGDGTPDFQDTDSDGDTVTDDKDNCRTTPNVDQTDTDGDGLGDACENEDADGDGIPDEVEGGGDADGDGVPNYRDTDADGDGIPDTVEAGDNPQQPVDTDGDGAPDYLDTDSDDDTIGDHDEAGANPGQPVDSDGDGVGDWRDSDSDGDGIPDKTEATDGSKHGTDPDGDGQNNWLDTDSDGDGIPDTVEAGDNPNYPVDSEHDGTPDYLDTDSDDDTIGDHDEAGANPGQPVDTDGDGVGDWRDPDSDDDGLSDKTEATDGETYGNDVDGDGQDNWHDTDSDGDGIPDGLGEGHEGPEDGDGDGVPAYLDPDDDGQHHQDQESQKEENYSVTGGAFFGCSTGRTGSGTEGTLLLLVLLPFITRLRRKDG